jgi:ABC-2 type transport system permease protein
MIRGKQYYKQTARACFSIFRIKTAEGFQYRMAALAGASTSIFWVLIEITVYTIFYKYGRNKEAGVASGMSLRQIISYAWLTQLLFLMQPMSIHGEILDKIVKGDVGIELCRPIDLYFHWFVKIAASKLTPMFWRGSVTIIAGLLMPYSYRLSTPATISGFLCMLLSLASAFLLCTAFGTLVTVVRLNIPWGDGPTYIMMLIGGVLSGGYLPLQLWPDFMQKFLLLQPFAGYLDIPLRLYVGTLPVSDAVWAIGLQLLWIAVFIALGKMLMSRQLKNIIVQGG